MPFRWYNAKLASRPLLTQAVTTSILFATGDITAQQVVDRRGLDKHDFVRTGRMALYGGVVFGPVATGWYNFLAKRIVVPRSRHLETVARVIVDQSVFAPTMIGVFLGSMAVLEGNDPRRKVETTWWPTVQTNWLVWPAVQAVNFTFLPLQHRVLFANVVSIGWNSYLSWVNGKEADVEEHDREDAAEKERAIQG